MINAIEFWEECTGTDKAEFAVKSGLWNVYTNLDGWKRTQTLDKYLSKENFPKLPNWSKIISTAEFALACSNENSEKRTFLENNLKQLKVVVSFPMNVI